MAKVLLFIREASVGRISCRRDCSIDQLNKTPALPVGHDETLNPGPQAVQCVLAFALSSFTGTAAMANPLVAPIIGFLGRLSFPRLFVLAAGLWALDMVIPDFIPFIDELLLGIGTLLLASFRKRKDPAVNAQDPLRKPPIEGERAQ
jgi:hypothetical protein